jgi:putative transposase
VIPGEKELIIEGPIKDIDRNPRTDTFFSSFVAHLLCCPTDEGWLYLSSIEDLFSRRIVGWAMDAHMETSLVLRALDMALSQRCPGENLVHHSDRGSQYASHAYRKALTDHGIGISMSRRGNCYDNACIESFWKTLKVELVYRRRFRTHDEAKAAIFEYIEVFYNRIRRHSSINYLSPAAFEMAHQQQRAS